MTDSLPHLGARERKALARLQADRERSAAHSDIRVSGSAYPRRATPRAHALRRLMRSNGRRVSLTAVTLLGTLVALPGVLHFIARMDEVTGAVSLAAAFAVAFAIPTLCLGLAALALASAGEGA